MRSRSMCMITGHLSIGFRFRCCSLPEQHWKSHLDRICEARLLDPGKNAGNTGAVVVLSTSRETVSAGTRRPLLPWRHWVSPEAGKAARRIAPSIGGTYFYCSRSVSTTLEPGEFVLHCQLGALGAEILLWCGSERVSKLMCGRHSSEWFGMPVSDPPECYCAVSTWKEQNEAPTLLFVTTLLVLVYYSGLALWVPPVTRLVFGR